MKHLKIYRAIRLIHRNGSIRKAAAELAISPSALNRSIQAFEDELSFAVFDRNSGGVRLSEAGELLLDVVERHLMEFSELQTQLGNLCDGEAGELRISIGTDICAGLVLDCISDLEEQFPGLSVELVPDDTTNSLLSRRVHFAVLTNPVTDDATEVIYSHKCPIAVWQTPGENVHVPAGLWDLTDTRITLPAGSTGSRAVIGHTLRRNRLVLSGVTTTSAAQLDHHMQRPGAIAAFPEIVFGSGGTQGTCRKLPMGLGTTQICALRLASMPVSHPAQAYLSLLQKKLEG